jgi:hypothetical protein
MYSTLPTRTIGTKVCSERNATKVIIRSLNSKDRQYNGQKKDRQYNGQKKDRQYNITLVAFLSLQTLVPMVLVGRVEYITSKV